VIDVCLYFLFAYADKKIDEGDNVVDKILASRLQSFMNSHRDSNDLDVIDVDSE
jgi:hypothetical protein